MPSIYGLKPKFQNLLRPVTNALANGGVGPLGKTERAFGFGALSATR
jgi:hypothetical protein